MKKIISIILCLCMVIAVGSVMAGCGNDEVLQRLDGLQAELQTQSGKIEELQTELKTQGGKIDELQTQHSQLTEKLEEMQTVLDEQAKKIENLKYKTANGEFYALYEAYNNGWLTQDDLMSIAYYHHDGRENNEEIMSENYTPAPKIPEALSEEAAKSIKKAWAKKLMDEKPDSTEILTEEDIEICRYYGTYNDCLAVIVDRFGMNYIDWGNNRHFKIGGVAFNYKPLGPIIIIYKI